MRVFLSYSAEDRNLVEPIYLALRAQGHSVFFDRGELAPGEEYDVRIRRAIEQSWRSNCPRFTRNCAVTCDLVPTAPHCPFVFGVAIQVRLDAKNKVALKVDSSSPNPYAIIPTSVTGLLKEEDTELKACKSSLLAKRSLKDNPTRAWFQ